MAGGAANCFLFFFIFLSPTLAPSRNRLDFWEGFEERRKRISFFVFFYIFFQTLVLVWPWIIYTVGHVQRLSAREKREKDRKTKK